MEDKGKITAYVPVFKCTVCGRYCLERGRTTWLDPERMAAFKSLDDAMEETQRIMEHKSRIQVPLHKCDGTFYGITSLAGWEEIKLDSSKAPFLRNVT